MGRTQKQKALLTSYRERRIVGGVCAIRCSATGRVLLLTSAEPESLCNRFQFSVFTGTCTHAALSADWKAWGGSSFTFECLETLERRDDQSDRAFRDDLDALTSLWRERLTEAGTIFYG